MRQNMIQLNIKPVGRFRTLAEIIEHIDAGRTDQVWVGPGYTKADLVEDLRYILARHNPYNVVKS